MYNQILYKVYFPKWTRDLPSYPRRQGTSKHSLTFFWEHQNKYQWSYYISCSGALETYWCVQDSWSLLERWLLSSCICFWLDFLSLLNIELYVLIRSLCLLFLHPTPILISVCWGENSIDPISLTMFVVRVCTLREALWNCSWWVKIHQWAL